MKTRLLYISLVLIGILSFGCKNDKSAHAISEDNPISLDKQSQPQGKEQTNTINNTTIPSTASKQNCTYAAFLEKVEAEICADYSDRIKDCYLMHANTIKSDFISKLPITLNRPYNKPINWDKYSETENFKDLWSYKCGFKDETTGTILNYYCPNLNGSAGKWIDSLAKENDLINSFKAEYKKSQNFSPQMQQGMILQAYSDLNFDDLEHRTFYWFYHFALAEVRQADAKFKTMIK